MIGILASSYLYPWLYNYVGGRENEIANFDFVESLASSGELMN